MRIKYSFRTIYGGWGFRILEEKDCKCDKPDWCGCGRCHRCGEWLPRRYDLKICERAVSRKSRSRDVSRLHVGTGRKGTEEIGKMLREYADQVQRSNLSPRSKPTYINNARNFVRWMHGDFQPGSRGPGKD